MSKSEIHREIKEFYSNIKSLYCKEINSYVYFNNSGLMHLHRKGGSLRSKSDQKRRFVLFRKHIGTISHEHYNISTKTSSRKNSLCVFIALEKCVGTKRIKIVLRRINDGDIHFFSIMEYRKQLKKSLIT